MLQRGTPKLGKDGKPMKDKRGKVIYEPYRIKVLNTINFKKSMHYNHSFRSGLLCHKIFRGRICGRSGLKW